MALREYELKQTEKLTQSNRNKHLKLKQIYIVNYLNRRNMKYSVFEINKKQCNVDKGKRVIFEL